MDGTKVSQVFYSRLTPTEGPHFPVRLYTQQQLHEQSQPIKKITHTVTCFCIHSFFFLLFFLMGCFIGGEGWVSLPWELLSLPS